MFEDVEVRVVGDNVFSIGSNSTINELVVIRIGLNQTEVDVDLLKLCGVQSGDSLYDVVGNLRVGLRGKNFLVLVQYVGVHAKADTTRPNLGLYLVIRTSAGQRLQQTVGVKNDASHRRRGCACALHPIVQWSAR